MNGRGLGRHVQVDDELVVEVVDGQTHAVEDLPGRGLPQRTAEGVGGA